MTYTKPTRKLEWIPDNTTNITDPSSKKTAGFTYLDKVVANYNNFLFNATSQWVEFLDATNFDTNTTITVTNATELAAVAEKLKHGFNINNNATVTIILATASLLVGDVWELNNIKGGKLILQGVSSLIKYDMQKAISIYGCTAYIRIKYINNITGSSAYRPLYINNSIVNMIDCRFPMNLSSADETCCCYAAKLTFNDCEINTINVDYVFQLYASTLVEFNTTTLAVTGAINIIRLFDNSTCIFDSYILPATCNIPIKSIEGYYPDVLGTLTFLVDDTNVSEVEDIASRMHINCDVTFKALDDISVDFKVGSGTTGISGNGKVTIDSNGNEFTNVYAYNLNTTEGLSFTGTCNKLSVAYCNILTIESGSLLGGFNSGATVTTPLYCYKCDSVFVNGTIRYWSNQGILARLSRVYLNNVFTYATNRVCFSAELGSYIGANDGTFNTGDEINHDTGSLSVYYHTVRTVNTTF